MAAKTFPFPHLSGENFSRWNVQMKTYLGGHDVWDAIEPGVETLMAAAGNSVKTQREVKVRDQKALSILQQGVDDANFERIAGVSTAKEAWDILTMAYKGVEKVQRIRLQTLRSDFEQLKQKRGESISDYFSRVQGIVNQLSQNGEKVKEVKIVEKILRSLDERYDFVVVAIEESKNVAELTVQELLGSMIAHEEKILKRTKESLEEKTKVKEPESDAVLNHVRTSRGRGRGRHRGGARGNGGRSQGSGRPQTQWQQDKNCNWDNREKNKGGQNRNKANVKCYNCNKFGHYASECYHKNHNFGKANMGEYSNEGSSDYKESTVLLACEGNLDENEEASPNNSTSMWCLDSGASNHMCGDEKMFNHIDVSTLGTVSFGDNSKCQVTGKGSIQIKLKDGRTDLISDVYLVPHMKTNILSLGQLLEKNYTVRMEHKEMTIRNHAGLKICQVKMTPNRMFMLKIHHVTPELCMQTRQMTKDNAEIWHQRLGHLNFRSLEKMHTIANGIPEIKHSTNTLCKGCMLGK